MPLPGWFVHFSAQLGNVKKNKKARVLSHILQLFIWCMYSLLGKGRPYCQGVYQKGKNRVPKSAMWYPFDRRGGEGSKAIWAQSTFLKRGSLIVMKLYVFHIWFASTYSLPVWEEYDLNVVVLSAGTDMIVILNWFFRTNAWGSFRNTCDVKR